MKIHVEVWRSHPQMCVAKADAHNFRQKIIHEAPGLIVHYIVDTSDDQQRRTLGTQIANAHQAGQAILTYPCIGDESPMPPRPRYVPAKREVVV